MSNSPHDAAGLRPPPTLPAGSAVTQPGSSGLPSFSGSAQTLGEPASVDAASDPHDDPATIPSPGDRIGGFVVERVLGAGAMGVVLLAQDPDLHRKVAIKLLIPHASSTEGAQRRLLREAQSVAALSHPNVVALHQVGMHRGRVYVVMEHVDGGTLRQWLAAASRTWPEIVEKYRQAAAGLAAAHAAGFVHRDFKPDNALIGTDGRVRVSDFGLVGASGEMSTTGDEHPISDVRLTQTGAVLGTPAYMAPEQYGGAAVDAAADQFALCVSLYEALHGRRPFSGNTPAALLLSVQSGEVLPAHRREVPSRIQRAIERGLASDPGQRHPSVAALAEALGPATPRRSPIALAVGVGIAVAAVGGISAAALSLRSEPDAASAGAEPATGCREPEPEVPNAWTPQAKARLEPLVRTAGIADPTPLLEGLDAEIRHYAEALAASEHRVCQAETEVSGEQHELRLHCLDELRFDFEAAVDVVASTERPIVARDGFGHISDLLDPARCEPEPAPGTPAPDHTTRDAKARRLVIRARTLEVSGDVEAAEGRVEEARALAEESGDDRALADAFHELARIRNWGGDSRGAEEAARRAVALARGLVDPRREWRSTVTLAISIAAQPNRVDEAIALIPVADAAALRSHDRGAWRYDIALGHVYGLAGKYDTARSHAEAAVDRLASGDRPRPFAVVEAHRTLADACLRGGAPERADDVYLQGLAAIRDALGPDHPQRALLLTGRALALTHRRHYDAASPIFAEAERILEPDVGRNREALGHNLLARADMERQRGRLDLAATAARKGIAILENAPGREELLINALVILGIVQFAGGELEDAHAGLTRAWTIAQRHPSSDRIAVNHLLSVLGGVELSLGNVDAAQLRHEQALEYLERKHGPAHPTVAAAAANVGDMQMVRGRYVDARRSYAKALGIRADLELPPDMDVVRILAGSARCSAATGELDRAREAAARVDALMAEGLGVPTYMPRAEMMRGEIAWQEGRRTDARAHVTAALEVWRSVPAQTDPQIRDAERWLAEHPA